MCIRDSPVSGKTCHMLSPRRPALPSFDIVWRHIYSPTATATDFRLTFSFTAICTVVLQSSLTYATLILLVDNNNILGLQTERLTADVLCTNNYGRGSYSFRFAFLLPGIEAWDASYFCLFYTKYCMLFFSWSYQWSCNSGWHNSLTETLYKTGSLRTHTGCVSKMSRKNRCHFFNYYYRFSWSIFIHFAPLETENNTLQ